MNHDVLRRMKYLLNLNYDKGQAKYSHDNYKIRTIILIENTV